MGFELEMLPLVAVFKLHEICRGHLARTQQELKKMCWFFLYIIFSLALTHVPQQQRHLLWSPREKFHKSQETFSVLSEKRNLCWCFFKNECISFTPITWSACNHVCVCLSTSVSLCSKNPKPWSGCEVTNSYCSFPDRTAVSEAT